MGSTPLISCSPPNAAEEQLAARDIALVDPEIKKRFGKGTTYNLKARTGRGYSRPPALAPRRARSPGRSA